jgi:serine protease AprX
MNIRVLNISLGTDSTQAYTSDPLAHAAEMAWRNGIVVVAAVGNAGSSTRTLADPASDPFVIAVGSEDPVGTIATFDDVVSPFSGRGTSERRPDLVAPGSYVLGLRAPGSTLDQQYPGARVGDRYLRGSGTSQATAIVSGAVADLLSARPNLTPDRVKRLLKRFATGIAGGSNYGVVLTGEQDIFGNPWNASRVAQAEESGTVWADGNFNGATWSGATWSGATWSGATWSGATWSGATWSGATWSGATWSGATWSGATWSGSTWSSGEWQ